MNRWEGICLSDYKVDYSLVSGKRMECIDGCGMCCLCQPEVLPEERPFFRKNHPDCLVTSRAPHRYTALAMKKGKGSCVFLNDERRCRVYQHRTAFCRQYPYHIYVSEKVEIEADLSCRGFWIEGGADAETEARELVAAADSRIRGILGDARSVYREFCQNAQEAGVWKDPQTLRAMVSECIDRFTDPSFVGRVLALSETEPEMSIGAAMAGGKVDMRDLAAAARDTALDSLSSEDSTNLPVYGAEDLSWNVFTVRRGVVEWSEIGNDGEFHHKGFVAAGEIDIVEPDEAGKEALVDYLSILNRRDSFMGSAMYIVDANGYEDDMTNAYFGSLATCVLDILWRAALLDRFFGTGFGARGIREAIIFYDMDRLDAPAIGAFI